MSEEATNIPLEEEQSKTEQEYTDQQERERQLQIDDLRTVLKHKSGYRVLKRILAKTQPFACTFTGDKFGDFLEGARNLGLQIMVDIEEACPEKLPQLVLDLKKIPRTKTGGRRQ